MYVMEGVSFERPDGTWQKIEVAVDDADFERVALEWGLKSAAIRQVDRHAVLAVHAEMLVFSRMKTARQHDDAWMASDATPLAEQISTRLKTLVGRLRA